METLSLSMLLLELLLVPSETGNEQLISNFIEDYFSDLKGFQHEKIGLSHIYQTQRIEEKKTISFYGHLDTVRNQQEIEEGISQGKIYGCGASDMKGGVAVMMKLISDLAEIPEAQHLYNYVFVFYDREEGPYAENGLVDVLKNCKELEKSDIAFVLEPTNNAIQVGCLGGLHAKVTFIGKSAHSARPWEGSNAIHLGWKLLSRLDGFGKKEVSLHGLQFFEVMNATMAHAGTTRNSIPPSFELNINFRFAPGKNIEDAKHEMIELIGSEPLIEFIDECPSGKVIVDNLLLQSFKDRFELNYEPKQAWTDIARLGLHGIPAVNCGPGHPSQAHQKNEWISENSLNKCYENYLKFLTS